MREESKEYSTYVILSGFLKIPDKRFQSKPIVEITSKPSIYKINIKKNKIIFYGDVSIRIIYATQIRANHSMIIFKVPFVNFIKHCHLVSVNHVKLRYKIEFQKFVIYDCKKISKFILLKVEAVE